ALDNFGGQPFQKRALAVQYFPARFGKREPAGAIDLGEGLAPPAFRRPDHLEIIADDVLRIEIAFKCEGGDDLAAGLTHIAEREEIAGRQRESGLLFEFAQRDGARVLTVHILAFRNRPAAAIALSPEGSAGMDEKHAEFARLALEQQNAGAALRHRLV